MQQTAAWPKYRSCGHRSSTMPRPAMCTQPTATAGYNKKFRAEHETEILLHQAAKEFFDKQGLKKLPKMKDLKRRVCRAAQAEEGGLSGIPQSQGGVGCSGFCGHRKISSDSSQKRHRSRTGSRADKRNTPKVDFGVGLWRVFCLYEKWKRSKGTRSLHPTDAVLRRVWESSQQAFLHGAGRTRSKNGRLVPVCTACTLYAAKKSSRFRNAYARISCSWRCTIWVKQSSRSCGAGMLECCFKTKVL